MLIGDPVQFAIESHIGLAYENPGARALGYFVVYLGGFCFGVRRPDASWLACSFDAVEDRLAHQGCHPPLFALVPDGELIANAYRFSRFAPDGLCEEFYAGLDPALAERLRSFAMASVLAPDGDEAFDDGSHILHFDLEDQVRLIGFKSFATGYRCDPATVRDVSLPADVFYGILQQWRNDFEHAWEIAPKPFVAGDGSPEHIAELQRLARQEIPLPAVLR